MDNLGRSPIALPTTSGAQQADVANGGLLDVRNEGQKLDEQESRRREGCGQFLTCAQIDELDNWPDSSLAASSTSVISK